ncbi:MAG TPA: HAMP domain-containing sensor histidine kinase [Candidatus Limnocylindrales bacterium]|nr:HAMP domain-containing sensor histidine kinase [Candidatus Limnocylindrales bacterium]
MSDDPGRGPWGSSRGPWGEPGASRRGPGRRRHGPAGGLGAVGCMLLGLVLVVGLVTTLATWVAAALLGILAPSAAPSTVTAVAVIVVLVLAILAGIRVFFIAVRPLTEIARATERLADGEPGVRVRARGPRPVRGLAASFNTMAERLDRSRDERRALLADVTHELRTPITVVQGGLEAMLDGVHPFDEDHVAPLLAETVVMGRLVDDLRTLSLADAGALTLHREPADLPAIARQAVAAQGPIAAAKGVALEVTGDGRLVTSVDPVRMREIVTNLVANALRHTASGGRVEVDVRADAGEALIIVRDTGEGIAAGDLPHVFDRFKRGADTGGSGLGLAIVRDLAEAHGGTVTAASEGIPGRGATFRVSLPRRD